MTFCRALVIDQLVNIAARKRSPVAFIYFDYRNQESQSPSKVFASILKQVLSTMSAIPSDLVETLQNLHERGLRLPQHETEQMILNIASRVPIFYLILDALDECDETNHRRSFINLLNRLKSLSNVRIFITSQPYLKDIESAFEKDLQIVMRARDADIRQYLSQELREADISGVDEQLAEDIVQSIVTNAQGV